MNTNSCTLENFGATKAQTKAARPAETAISPRQASNRLAREWRTIEAMVRIYCRDHHHGQGLCPECQGLLDYAGLRLDRCRFGPEKPTCAKCPVHCYARDRREQVKTVMRYSGPRMLWEHPLMSIRHCLDGWFRPTPRLGVEKSCR